MGSASNLRAGHFWTWAPPIGHIGFVIITTAWLTAGMDPDVGLLVEQLAFAALLIGVILAFGKQAAAGWKKPRGWSWIWVAGPLWLSVLSPLGLAIPNIAATPERAILWIGASLFIGLNEEFVFRGFLFGGLRRSLGPLPAALVSSLVFGVAHSVNAISGADPMFLVGQMSVAVGTGLVLAAVTLRAESVWPVALIHFAGDAVGISAFGGIEATLQAAEAAPSLIIFGAITAAWGLFWIWRMSRKAASESPQPDALRAV